MKFLHLTTPDDTIVYVNAHDVVRVQSNDGFGPRQARSKLDLSNGGVQFVKEVPAVVMAIIEEI